jgi:hypothetical protein
MEEDLVHTPPAQVETLSGHLGSGIGVNNLKYSISWDLESESGDRLYFKFSGDPARTDVAFLRRTLTIIQDTIVRAIQAAEAPAEPRF